jgi:hypothetical protein
LERGERPLSLPRGEEREVREREKAGDGVREREREKEREREREGERDAQKKRVPEVICEAVT